MRWPWQTETRAAPESYTDKIVSEILSRASGKATDAGALAAVEAAVGFIARSLSTARVTPANNLTAGVTPSFLQQAGRRLARTGNFVALIEVQGGGVTFIPATSYDVSGEASRETWTYRLSLGGPSLERTVRTSGDGVLHFKVNSELSWRGRSPLEVASATGKLAAAIEQSLQVEQLFLPARVIYTERTGNDVTELLKDIASGGILADGGLDESSPPPRAPEPIGPEPNAVQAGLRTDVGRAIIAAFGLSPSMFEAGSDGTAQRESFRRAFTTCLNPWAMMIAQELSEKLETPVELSLGEIRAADAQSQARAIGARATAVKHLTESGVPVAAALELAGFGDV